MMSTQATRRGFTLIELLVVIAIIAILAAILFPVFAKAREKAYQAKCVSNQRQITTALQMYIQDHDEMLPTAENVWGELKLPKNALQCPTQNNTKVSNSYVFNYCVGGKPLAAFSDPTLIPVIADGQHTGTPNSIPPTVDNVFYSPLDVSYRHGDKIIGGYLDGHVELTKEFSGTLAFAGLTEYRSASGGYNITFNSTAIDEQSVDALDPRFQWMQNAGLGTYNGNELWVNRSNVPTCTLPPGNFGKLEQYAVGTKGFHIPFLLANHWHPFRADFMKYVDPYVARFDGSTMTGACRGGMNAGRWTAGAVGTENESLGKITDIGTTTTSTPLAPLNAGAPWASSGQINDESASPCTMRSWVRDSNIHYVTMLMPVRNFKMDPMQSVHHRKIAFKTLSGAKNEFIVRYDSKQRSFGSIAVQFKFMVGGTKDDPMGVTVEYWKDAALYDESYPGGVQAYFFD